MIPKAGIEEALDGGWKPTGLTVLKTDGIWRINVYPDCFSFWVGEDQDEHELMFEEVILDRTFWQALGKVKGWKYKAYKNGHWITEDRDLMMMSDTPFRYHEWHWQAQRFCDLVYTEQPVDVWLKFWGEILE